MSSEPNLPATQRAYTLRLSGTNREDAAWRDRLWRTHDSVNQGAKIFGDWLLTLRGGLCHTLADGDPDSQKDRRIILALSWLSVESAAGAPDEFLVPHTEDHKNRPPPGLAGCRSPPGTAADTRPGLVLNIFFHAVDAAVTEGKPR